MVYAVDNRAEESAIRLKMQFCRYDYRLVFINYNQTLRYGAMHGKYDRKDRSYRSGCRNGL